MEILVLLSLVQRQDGAADEIVQDIRANKTCSDRFGKKNNGIFD